MKERRKGGSERWGEDGNKGRKEGIDGWIGDDR
jgi:hypothetical protein